MKSPHPRLDAWLSGYLVFAAQFALYTAWLRPPPFAPTT